LVELKRVCIGKITKYKDGKLLLKGLFLAFEEKNKVVFVGLPHRTHRKFI